MIVLQHLLYNITPQEIIYSAGAQAAKEKEVVSICTDSRACVEGSLFAALPGTQIHGKNFIPTAVKNGAVFILVEEKYEDLQEEEHVVQIIVKDVRAALGEMAASFYGRPSEKLKLIGVTGTNGKTSTITLLHEALMRLGHPAAMLSTVVNRIGMQEIPATHTTPDVINLNKFLADAVKQGCEYACMEVSSHGVVQQRIAALEFHIAGFTNLTRDHLDYHGDFASYRDAKKKFFDKLSNKAVAITNADDKNAGVMLQNTKAKKRQFALHTPADYMGKVREISFTGMELEFDGKSFHTPLVGEFNASNLLLVYSICTELGFEKENILQTLSLCGKVKGRFETHISPSGIFVVIDYAHTTDALENVLSTIISSKQNTQRIITIVGCGGDRDAGKRPQMAKIAIQYSTISIFTSDNPRNEDPEKILFDMTSQLSEKDKQKYIRITDRKEAIRKAIAFAEPQDIILIAGKGHETYQEIKGERYPFDDTEIFNQLIQTAGK